MSAIDEQRFAGIRHESFFFSPFASRSAILISTKHIAYIVMIAGISILAGFSRIDMAALAAVPILGFFGFYRHRGVQMEYVIMYLLSFIFNEKKSKEGKTRQHQKKTSAVFSSASFGRIEKFAKKEKSALPRRKPKIIRIQDLDYPQEVKLNVGVAHRLKRVDVYIGSDIIATSDAVESDGMVHVIFTPSNTTTGAVQVKVTDAGTQNVIASETIILEEISKK